MELKHVVLAALAHVAIAAAAQQVETRTVNRNVNVQEDNGTCTVTITTTENGSTSTRTLTGEEAAAWLKVNGGCHMAKGEGTPDRCVVIVTDDDRSGKGEADGKGTSKASMMRYRYGTKETTDGQVITRKEVKVTVVVNDEGSDATPVADPEDVRNTTIVDGGLLRLYPNPSDGRFTIEFTPPGEGETLITVVDGAGREIFSEHTSVTGRQTRSFDLSGERKGTFIASLVQGGTSVSKMLVIE